MKTAVVCFALIALTIGCGPKPAGDETSKAGVLRQLVVEPGNRKAHLSWTRHTDRLIAGYNVYISEVPLVEKYPGTALPETVQPFNATPFPGDTEPEDGIEHFVAEGLDNGVRYFVSVRIVYPDRALSEPSAEAMLVCGPRGEIELSIRLRSDRDGYSFENDNYVRAQDLQNDLYYFSKDGVDYLASPSRLDPFLRTNNLVVLPYRGELDEVKTKLTSLDPQLFGDRVIVNRGDWVLLRTPEDRSALLKVLAFAGEGTERRVRIFFAYSTLTDGEMFF